MVINPGGLTPRIHIFSGPRPSETDSTSDRVLSPAAPTMIAKSGLSLSVMATEKECHWRKSLLTLANVPSFIVGRPGNLMIATPLPAHASTLTLTTVNQTKKTLTTQAIVRYGKGVSKIAIGTDCIDAFVDTCMTRITKENQPMNRCVYSQIL